MKRKKISKFIIFLLIYSLVICIAITVGLLALHSLLKDYEAGMPAKTMDEVMENFREDNLFDFLSGLSVDCSEFDNTEIVYEYMLDKVSNNDVYYRKKGGEYAEDSPVYDVYAGDTVIAKVSLAELKKNKHNFTEWKLGEVAVSEYLPDEKVEITVPKGSSLYFNDVCVSSDYIVEDNLAIDACENIAEYVSVPYNTVYSVDGMIKQPDIKVIFNDNELEIKEDKDSYVAEFPSDEALLAKQESSIYYVLENYAKYMIGRGDLSVLKEYMVGNASRCISDVKYVHVYLLGKTFTYDIGNESISDFKKYSDDCFSCNVKCDLHIEYSAGDYTGAGETTYNIDLIFTYVKTGADWKLADFSIN
ncbi:MAG: hypothetical protein ACI4E1_06575 [Lachnospira sp.]